MSRLTRFAALLAAAIIACLVVSAPALAYVPDEVDTSLEKPNRVVLKPFYANQGYHYKNCAYLKAISGSARPSQVKVSNRKVATVVVKHGGLVVHFKKPGATRVAYTYKGKRHAVVLKAIQYRNPTRYVKTGTVNLAKRFRQGNAATVPAHDTLRVRSARGWTLLSAWGSYNDGWTYGKRLANNKAIPAGVTDVNLVFKNRTTKMRQPVYLHF